MAEPKTVVLVDPNGVEFHATHPAEITNLVYGAGYKLKDKNLTPDKASALLAEKGAAAEVVEAQSLAVEAPKK